ncbi:MULTISPECIES: DDE-type integrase/transposase/recombinase [unclassified Rhizobium]|uniref:DDE-type integrase/transposase/recombinase n=1 Tax=unclassified Rhizobium TaxID=2613769 RepID=UPI003830ED8E
MGWSSSRRSARCIQCPLTAGGGKWRVDERYTGVRATWTYLFQAIDRSGAAVDFLFSKTRNLNDAKHLFLSTYAS